jgi:hypothetical protein
LRKNITRKEHRRVGTFPIHSCNDATVLIGFRRFQNVGVQIARSFGAAVIDDEVSDDDESSVAAKRVATMVTTVTAANRKWATKAAKLFGSSARQESDTKGKTRGSRHTWTKIEDEQLAREMKKCGKRWTEIARSWSPASLFKPTGPQVSEP